MSAASSASGPLSQADIITHSEPVQTLLNNPPRAQQPHLAVLVEWIIKLGFGLVGMVANLAKHITDQADEAFKTAHHTSSQFAQSAAAATASQCDTTPSPKQCNRCHAHGHTVDNCKTIQPSAMRKRVAHNNRIPKEARRAPAQPPPSVSPPFPWLPSPYPPLYPSAAPTYHMASLATDAAELRRCSAQSAHDKQCNRRSQSCS